jgi:hypothetical protein
MMIWDIRNVKVTRSGAAAAECGGGGGGGGGGGHNIYTLHGDWKLQNVSFITRTVFSF